jgi:Tol biopolymer transport system component
LFRDDHPSSGIGYPLFRARPDGSHVRVLSKRPGLFSDWRADGRRIAFDFFRRNGSEQIATMRPNGTDLPVITSGKGIHEVPSYSPSGRRIVFDASRQDPNSPTFHTHLWVMRADGSHAHPLAMANRAALTLSRGTLQMAGGSLSTGSGPCRTGSCRRRSW